MRRCLFLMLGAMLLLGGCDREPGTYSFIYIYSGNDLSDTFSSNRASRLTEAWLVEDVTADGFIIRDDDLIIRSERDAVLTLTAPIRVEASDVTFEDLNIRIGSDLMESAIIMGSDEETLENIAFRNVTIETAPGSAYHVIDADDVIGFEIDNVSIGESQGAAIYLTATDDMSVAQLDTGKEAGLLADMAENDAAIMLGWEPGRTMRPCSIGLLSTAEPVYAEAAIYIDSDGSVYSPPLGSKGQHMMERASTPIPVEAKLSEIRDSLNAYSPKQDVAEDAEADKNITIGYWWNIAESEEETI